jgi:hypothetical protein
VVSTELTTVTFDMQLTASHLDGSVMLDGAPHNVHLTLSP